MDRHGLAARPLLECLLDSLTSFNWGKQQRVLTVFWKLTVSSWLLQSSERRKYRAALAFMSGFLFCFFLTALTSFL